MKRELQVEVSGRACVDKSIITHSAGTILVTPPIGEDFWLMRVRLSDKQAIVAFPKFTTIGCGFQREEDWNTNLPLGCTSEEIYNHIKRNKGDDGIPEADCVRAIDMLRDEAVKVGAISQADIDRMRTK
jgi:hypothetical protein